MPTRSTFVLLTVLAVLSASPKAAAQEGDPPAGEARHEVAPIAALTDEDREAIELLRHVLAEEGREAARELLEEFVDGLGQPEAGAERAHLAYLLELDRVAKDLGSLPQALRLWERVLAIRAKLLPADHVDVLAAKNNLAGTMLALGDLQGAHELFEVVLDARMRLLPPDHPDLLKAMANLAAAKYALDDYHGARELQETVHSALSELLPSDHSDLLVTKNNLALTRKSLGDLRGARELQEAVLAARLRLLPPDHRDLLSAKNNLAATRYALGDIHGARELQESVLAARLQLLPSDHPELLTVMTNLALSRKALGDLQGALELQEIVLSRRQVLPSDHSDVLTAKTNLALTRFSLGDLQGSLELQSEVLEAWTRLLPSDHLLLITAKASLARTMWAIGDYQGAQELQEAVLMARARLLPPDHPELLVAKNNLAATLGVLRDLDGARRLQESVIDACSRFLPPDHPDLLAARNDLATTRFSLGDLKGAHELQESVLEARVQALPPSHADLLRATQNLAAIRHALSDLDGTRDLVARLLEGLRIRARELRAEAVRPARESAQVEIQRLFAALYLSQHANTGPGLEGEILSTLEELRFVSAANAEMSLVCREHPDLAELAQGVAQARTRLGDLGAACPQDEADVEQWRKELLACAEERDGAERELRRRLAESGTFVGMIDGASLAVRLAQGEVIASFLRYPRRFENDPATGEAPPTVDSFLAFLLKPDETVLRIELGPTAELEKLVRDWRARIGKPIEGEATATGERSEEELGRALRARVLDPLFAAAGEDVEELHVVLDDLLFLVPLDALPLEGAARVGERIVIHVEPTLARLLRGPRPVPSSGRLVAVGAVDFDAEDSAGAEKSAAKPARALLTAATPPLDRSGRSELLERLPQTGVEVDHVGARFAEAFDREPLLLRGGAATKSALHAAAPEARFLHLATHGWFASERFKSQLDSLIEESARSSFLRAEATLIGFAPETLCGLALAGANRGRDALGRVPGILTAEELASFDLRNCELAVLSACETNVGIRRAGQGIQSLQSALHAAGARTAITSLWRVDDAATQRLFELFYDKLWREKLGKHEALWQAKMALRAERHPTRNWAGWVLSGDPD